MRRQSDLLPQSFANTYRKHCRKENMKNIILWELEKWIEEEEVCVQQQNSVTQNISAGFIIYGEPCRKLLALQEAGYCVLAELKHLQGLTEAETADALCREQAVQQFKYVCICARDLPREYLCRIWCKSNRLPVEIAETERLLIRESIEEDAEAFCRLYQDPVCLKYLEPLSLKAQTIEEYRQYLTAYDQGQYAFYEYGMWTVVEKASGAIVGRMGLEQTSDTQMLNLGYALLPEFRGMGYAQEGCLAILKYCEACGYAEKVLLTIDRENINSLSTAHRLQAFNDTGVELLLKIM